MQIDSFASQRVLTTPEETDFSHGPNAPENTPEQIVVVTYFANLRAWPVKTSLVVDRVEPDEQLVLIKPQGNWAEVRKSNNTVGWIRRNLIRPRD